MSRVVPLTLLGICAMLAIGIAYEIFAPLGSVLVGASGRPKAFAASANLTAPPEETFAAIDARPIFNPARTPVPDAVLAAGGEGSLSDLLLVGVIVAPDKAIAVLKDKSTSQTTSISAGSYIDGWRVETINKAQVTLASPKGQIVLPLDNPAMSGTQPAVSPSQPPAATITPPPLPPSTGAVATASKETAPLAAPSAATSPAAKPGAKSGLLMPTAHGNIAPAALKGAPIDPSTGEPTL